MEIKKTYAVEWIDNKLQVATNYTPVRLVENFYYKIKRTPETRGYALNYKTPGDPHIAPDETLFFLYSELGDGNFELTFRAFFTGVFMAILYILINFFYFFSFGVIYRKVLFPHI